MRCELYRGELNGRPSSLAESWEALAAWFAKVKSIKAEAEPETMELVGERLFTRYKQSLEMQFRFRSSSSTIWYIAEDTWETKNGGWRRMSMTVVDDSKAQWQQRLEAQKKQIEIQDEQRKSRACLNGLGYNCGYK